MQSTGFAAEVFTCILIHVWGTQQRFSLQLLTAGFALHLNISALSPIPRPIHTRTHETFISAHSHLVHYLVTVTIDMPR